MEISSSSGSEEIAPIALAIHEILNRLPITMRTKNSKGVRIEDGEIVDYEYTGPILEKALNSGEIIREVPHDGEYSGIPVIVVPIKEEGQVIGAIGVVDTTKGIFSDLKEMTRSPNLIKNNSKKGEFY